MQCHCLAPTKNQSMVATPNTMLEIRLPIQMQSSLFFFELPEMQNQLTENCAFFCWPLLYLQMAHQRTFKHMFPRFCWDFLRKTWVGRCTRIILFQTSKLLCHDIQTPDWPPFSPLSQVEAPLVLEGRCAGCSSQGRPAVWGATPFQFHDIYIYNLGVPCCCLRCQIIAMQSKGNRTTTQPHQICLGRTTNGKLCSWSYPYIYNLSILKSHPFASWQFLRSECISKRASICSSPAAGSYRSHVYVFIK